MKVPTSSAFFLPALPIVFVIILLVIFFPSFLIWQFIFLVYFVFCWCFRLFIFRTRFAFCHSCQVVLADVQYVPE